MVLAIDKNMILIRLVPTIANLSSVFNSIMLRIFFLFFFSKIWNLKRWTYVQCNKITLKTALIIKHRISSKLNMIWIQHGTAIIFSFEIIIKLKHITVHKIWNKLQKNLNGLYSTLIYITNGFWAVQATLTNQRPLPEALKTR